jgi:hypothetical protein
MAGIASEIVNDTWTLAIVSFEVDCYGNLTIHLIVHTPVHVARIESKAQRFPDG